MEHNIDKDGMEAENSRWAVESTKLPQVPFHTMKMMVKFLCTLRSVSAVTATGASSVSVKMKKFLLPQ